MAGAWGGSEAQCQYNYPLKSQPTMKVEVGSQFFIVLYIFQNSRLTCMIYIFIYIIKL
jgi:hypothetical protein